MDAANYQLLRGAEVRHGCAMSALHSHTLPQDPTTALAPSWPAVVFMCALFTMNGIVLPYFPVYLEEARGFSGGQIGMILAVSTLLRVLTGPLIAAWSEEAGFRRSLGLTCIAVVAGYAAIDPLGPFAAVAALSVFSYAMFASTMPLAEAALMAVTGRERGRISYGFARALGSAGFVCGNLAGGALLNMHGPDLAIRLIVGCALFLAITTIWMDHRPRNLGGPREHVLQAMVSGLGLLRHRRLLLLTLAGAAIQASHAYYYNFSAVIWTHQGIGSDVVGVLWSLGVVAEIILLFLAARFLSHRSAETLIAIGALGGMVRWFALGFAPDLAVLYPVQTLHAATFAATHLGMLKAINDEVAPARIPVAVAINSAIAFGPAMAVSALASGALFDAFAALGPAGEARGYWLMSVLCAIGLGLAIAARTGRKHLTAP